MPQPSCSLRPLHLAFALDGPPRRARRATAVHDPEHYVRLARLAERGTLDFVTLGDSFARPGPDALAVLARVAPRTGRVGLVPAVTTTHTEPFHVSIAVNTLDWVSRGRAGWTVEVSGTPAEARLFGRREAAPADALWREAGEVADVAARLWDSWEDDAEIRDTATGRFVDRDKLHYVDFRGASFSVRGPSITPRPPQGRPVVAVDATARPARQVAAAHADVAFVRVEDPATAAAARADLRERARALGRDPDRLLVLASLPVELYSSGDAVGLADLLGDWHADGAGDGFHLRPADPVRDLALLVDGTVPVLQHRCLLRRFYPGTTLREHLGLPRPANRYAPARKVSS
ncbi:LLM class flavin-dependent oxidoreductase [Streptomyces paromomycinus]|uniref:Putative FMNH2-utilizing oxygenase n=1 Tax=Streptomyces paromomycinus TaxID=92743 RepID=A0A401WCA4_STREY|nr:LLM class flavin-dependent oxidoreductase [Streptomyces paromomycinus]GCD46899.1 putative FMNH2-utilizing oxygenase [Streptomyces paromomycinus]